MLVNIKKTAEVPGVIKKIKIKNIFENFLKNFSQFGPAVWPVIELTYIYTNILLLKNVQQETQCPAIYPILINNRTCSRLI